MQYITYHINFYHSIKVYHFSSINHLDDIYQYVLDFVGMEAGEMGERVELLQCSRGIDIYCKKILHCIAIPIDINRAIDPQKVQYQYQYPRSGGKSY